jgi:hypothetical protein
VHIIVDRVDRSEVERFLKEQASFPKSMNIVVHSVTIEDETDTAVILKLVSQNQHFTKDLVVVNGTTLFDSDL